MYALIIAALCLIFGYMRLTMNVVSEIHHDDIFKDLAHLFVGSLFGSAILASVLARRISLGYVDLRKMVVSMATWFWFVAIVMTVLEVGAFILHKP